jgi:ketosteroid isomerase-like protein
MEVERWHLILVAAAIGCLFSIQVVPTVSVADPGITNTDMSPQDGPTSSLEGASASNLDVLSKAEQALEALDAEALVSLYADNFLFEDTSFSLRITDKAELRSYFDSLFSWPEVTFSNARYFGHGQRAAGEWTMGGLSRVSGEPFSIRGASLFKIEGGKITEEIIFYDPRATLR